MLYVKYCMIYVKYCMLYVQYCMLYVIYCMFNTVWYMLYVIYCMLYTVCYMLNAVCYICYALYCMLYSRRRIRGTAMWPAFCPFYAKFLLSEVKNRTYDLFFNRGKERRNVCFLFRGRNLLIDLIRVSFLFLLPFLTPRFL